MSGDATHSATAGGRVRADAASSWRITLPALGVVFGSIVLLYGQSFWSMVSIWSRSDTFAHGYFIVPISLYVAWTERGVIARSSPNAAFWPLFLIPLLGLGWLAARLAGVLVMEQYFAVAILIVALVAVLGAASALRLAFPLGFLLLAVPVGEALLPILIESTATFTVHALRLSGIAALREGNQLTLSNGVWSVVEACSGLRYLIACVTIGLPFAYLTYSSWRRRLAFVAASVVVPIVANWIRAYMIIVIGYLSDMKLAVSVDHLLYGWVFYAIVMFLLLWVGARFAQPRSEEPAAPGGLGPLPGAGRRTFLVASGALLLAGIWPAWASYASSSSEAAAVTGFRLPDAVGAWTAGRSALVFEPQYRGADVVDGRLYESASGTVALQVAVYGSQRQGAELVSSRNVLLSPDDPDWRQLQGGSFAHDLVSVDERVGSSRAGRLLIWRWYWVDGELTSSSIWAKIVESERKLLGRPTPAAGIVVYTRTGPDLTDARRTLAEFVDAAMPELETRLREAAE